MGIARYFEGKESRVKGLHVSFARESLRSLRLLGVQGLPWKITEDANEIAQSKMRTLGDVCF